MVQHAFADWCPPSRVVVLGGTGFIGSHVARELADREVTCLAVPSSQIDLTAPRAVESLTALLDPRDTLVVAACVTRDRGESLATMMRNLAMVEHVSAALESSGCAHVVYLSTVAVYRDDLPRVNEASEQRPSTLYGLAHMVRERMIAYSCQRAGIPLAILRPCAVFGPGNTHDTYGPDRFLRTAAGEGRIVLFGEGTERRHHMFVQDVSRIITEVIGRGSAGTLNVASGQPISFRDIATAVGRVIGQHVPLVSAARREAATDRHIDTSVLAAAFPGQSETALEDGLRQSASHLVPV